VRLLLVRHGITQHNIERRYMGQTDAPLTELGERQAAAVGQYLAQEKLDAILSSDLQRARNTARAIASHHNLPVLEDPDLREISMGEWEGLSVAQIQERDSAAWKFVRSDPSNNAPPGGENFSQLRDRAARVLRYCQENYTGQTVLWTTHGGLIGTTICHILKLDLSYRRCFRSENTSITEINLGEELPLIERLNDTAHLHILAKTIAV
jgi:broad specificity phosphatase PhoE